MIYRSLAGVAHYLQLFVKMDCYAINLEPFKEQILYTQKSIYVNEIFLSMLAFVDGIVLIKKEHTTPLTFALV